MNPKPMPVTGLARHPRLAYRDDGHGNVFVEGRYRVRLLGFPNAFDERYWRLRDLTAGLEVDADRRLIELLHANPRASWEIVRVDL